MRLFEFTMLREGGNIFKDENKVPVTQRIDKADVDPTLKWLEKIVKLDLVNHKLGTTGRRESSGDLDIAVDEKAVSKDDIVGRLKAWTDERGLNPKEWIRKSGASVHFKTPILGDEKNGFVQTDLMFGDPDWMAWSLRGALGDSPFKGQHRHILMASIASAQGMKWSYQRGLLDRESDETLSRDPDVIAQLLLGKGSKKDDLEDVETIIEVIKNRPDYDQLVANAKEHFAREGLELP